MASRQFERLRRYTRMLIGMKPPPTPVLIPCAKAGDVAGVSAALDNGDDIEVEEVGMTPLMVAAYWGNAGVVRLLLLRGARADSKQIQHAIAWARARGFREVVSLLEEATGRSGS